MSELKTCLNVLDQKLMQKTFSAAHRNIERTLDHLPAKFFTGMLEICLQVDQCLPSGPAGQLNDLCSDGGKLIRYWLN